MLWDRISIRARCTTLCDKVCQWLATCQGFSPGPQVSSTNKTDRHDITEILLKVALTKKQTKNNQCCALQYIPQKILSVWFKFCCWHNFFVDWLNEIFVTFNLVVLISYLQGFHYFLGWRYFLECRRYQTISARGLAPRKLLDCRDFET